jgi:hypothetical protein
MRRLKEKSQQRDRRVAAKVDVSDGRMLLLKPDELAKAHVEWPNYSRKTR